jgi:hypothetical protein
VSADRIHEQTFFVEAELAGARVVDVAIGVGEDEVTLALDREIGRISGLADVAGIGAQTLAGNARAATAAATLLDTVLRLLEKLKRPDRLLNRA